MDPYNNNSFVVLKTLALAENRQRYPSLPEYARVIPKYTDRTANGLTKCIIDFLRLSGWQAERISVTGRLIDRRKKFTDCLGRKRMIGSVQWIKPSMQPGTADISATIAGKSVKIEVKCKSTHDRIRPEQIKYKQQIEQAGGLYVIATDFSQFLNWYTETYNPELRAKSQLYEG